MGSAADLAPCAYPVDSRRDEAAPDRVAREVHAIAHPELLEDVGPVPVDGLAADHEHLRDLVARVTLGDKLDDLDLARSQGIQRAGFAAARAVEIVAHQRADGAGVQEGLTAHGRAACVDEI